MFFRASHLVLKYIIASITRSWLHCFEFNCVSFVITAKSGPFRATQLWNEMVDVLRQEISMKRRRVVGRHRGQEESFSGSDAVDIVLKFLRERRDQFTATDGSSKRDKAVKVQLCSIVLLSFQYNVTPSINLFFYMQ